MKHRKRASSVKAKAFSPSALFALLAFSAVSSDLAYGTPYTWNVPGNGNWTATTNWNPNSAFPNGNTDIANFTGSYNSVVDVTLGMNISIQDINFNTVAGDIQILGIGSISTSTSVGGSTFTASDTHLHQIFNNISLQGDLTGTVTSTSGALILNGDISGNFSFNKLGSGPLSLTGSNTYSAGTTIQNGTLAITNYQSLGTGTVSWGVLGSGILDVTGTISLAHPLSNDLDFTSGSGTIKIENPLAAVFSGAITGDGGGVNNITINKGSLTLTSITSNFSGKMQLRGPTSLTISDYRNLSNATVQFIDTNCSLVITSDITSAHPLNNSLDVSLQTGNIQLPGHSVVYSGVVSGDSLGNNNLNIFGGTLTLTDTSSTSFKGMWNLRNAATLAISDYRNLSSTMSTVQFVDPNCTLEITANIPAFPPLQNFFELTNDGAIFVDSGISAEIGSPGQIDGGAALVISGPGDLVIAANNTYVGGTQITGGGTVSISHDYNLGNTSGPFSFLTTPSTLIVTANVTTGRNLVLGTSGTISVAPSKLLTWNGIVNGGGLNPGDAVTIAGGGNVIFSNSSNNYTDTTITESSTLEISSVGSLGSGDVTFSSSGGFLEFTATSGPYTNTFVFDDVSGLVVDSGVTATISGQLTGTNGFSKDGTGTLVISGQNNDYSGTTSINQGTLQAGNFNIIAPSSQVDLTGSFVGTFDLNGFDQTIDSLTGASNTFVNLNGAALTIAGSSSTEYDGTIKGNGSLVQDGTGTFTLTGSNTYIGTTVLEDGFLSISQDANLGDSSSHVVFDGGTLDVTATMSSSRTYDLNGPAFIDISATKTFTISGIIDGPSSLEITGPGTLILSGNNTYAAGTNIAAGTLSVSSDANLGAVGGPLTFSGLGGELDITANTTISRNIVLNAGGNNESFFVPLGVSATLSGVISGGAQHFVKLGQGTLFLTGNNTFTGILISAGTLQGTSNSLLGNILNSTAVAATPALVFNQDFDGTFAGSITGAGTGFVAKSGSGTLNLTGVSLYAAATQVNAGTLLVNGTLNSGGNVTVAAGAVLGGTGTLSAPAVNVSGAISPGNSIGLFTINGNVEQLPGSSVINEFNPTDTDFLQINGTYKIDSGTTLQLVPDQGLYTVGTSFVIIDATGGITGQFTTISNPAPALQFALGYGNPDFITLTITGVSFGNAGIQGNAGGVARCADMSTAPAGSDFATILSEISSLTLPELTYVFNQMQPSSLKSLVVSQQNIMLEVESALNERYTYYHPTKCDPEYKEKKAVWMETFGSSQTQHEKHVNNSTQPAYTTRTFGVLLGSDVPFGKGFSVGGLTGYTRGYLSMHDNAGHGHIESVYLGPYAKYGNDRFYVNASILGEANWYKADRNIHFIDVNRTAHNSHSGVGALFHAGAGVWVKYGKLDFSPFFNADFITMHEGSFKETGAQSLNLHVHSSAYQYRQLEGGFLFRTCAKIKQGYLIPEVRLSGVAEQREMGADYAASLPDTNGCGFVAEGYYPNRNLFVPAAKLKALLWEERLMASVYFQGKYGDGFTQDEFGINVAWNY